MVDPVHCASAPQSHEHCRRLNPAAESPSSVAQSPWTAARCNRLLRPVSSKLAALRKIRQAGSTTHTAAAHSDLAVQRSNAGRPIESFSESIKVHTHVPGPSHNSQDALWDTSPRQRKRIKRTYSSKAKPQLSAPLLVSEETTVLDACNIGPLGIPSQLRVPSDSFGVSGTRPGLKSGEGWNCSMSGPEKSANVQCEFDECSLKARRSTVDSSWKANHQSARRGNRDCWKLYDGIIASLGVLLKATQSNIKSQVRGSRSLFSTCLSNVPRYIADEEHWSKLDDDSDGDANCSSQIYAELESYAIIDGWEPLREVVRAHGLYMIGSAIEDNVIELEVADEIVAFCLSCSAHKEAQTLVESMMNIIKPRDSCISAASPVDNRALILHTVQQFAAKTGQYGFLFRKVADLVESDILSTTGLSASSLKDCWNRMMQSIIWESVYLAEASSLFQILVRKTYEVADSKPAAFIHRARERAARAAGGRQGLRSFSFRHTMGLREDGPTETSDLERGSAYESETPLSQIVAELLTILLAINISQTWHSPNENDSYRGVWTVIQNTAIEAIQALELFSLEICFGQIFALKPTQLNLPLLTLLITLSRAQYACADEHTLQMTTLNLLASLPRSDESTNKMSSFLCGVAQCCEKVTSSAAFDFSRHIIQRLVDLSSSSTNTGMTRSLCSSIAETAAFTFSQSTSQPTHLDWALGVESTVRSSFQAFSRPTCEGTPARDAVGKRQGYRWEDGICEWIAKTPGMLVDKMTVVRSSIQIPDRHITKPAVTVLEELPQPRLEVSPCSKAKKSKVSECLAKNSGRAYLSCVKTKRDESFEILDHDADELSSSPRSQVAFGHVLARRIQTAKQHRIRSLQSCQRLEKNPCVDEFGRNDTEKENWDVEDELSFG